MAPESWREGLPHVPHTHLRRPEGVPPAEWLRRLELRYVRLRLLGWVFIGAWQVLGLASEFWPIDLESDAMRITGRVLGLLGLVLVAWGFERLTKLSRRLREAQAAQVR